MTTEDTIAVLMKRANAHDLILKHMLNMVVGLGSASGAWEPGMASDALSVLSKQLKDAAGKTAVNGADVMTLLAFVLHASENAEAILPGSRPRNPKHSGPQS